MTQNDQIVQQGGDMLPVYGAPVCGSQLHVLPEM
jgi:hypothetical protein